MGGVYMYCTVLYCNVALEHGMPTPVQPFLSLLTLPPPLVYICTYTLDRATEKKKKKTWKHHIQRRGGNEPRKERRKKGSKGGGEVVVVSRRNLVAFSFILI